MSRILKEQDIKEIIYGGAFLGAGGGGGLADGLIMLKESVERNKDFQVTLISPEEMTDNTYAVMIAGMGAPQALAEKENKYHTETQLAFDALSNSSYLAGKRLKAIMPIEYGSVTAFIPMIACAEKGIPLLDVDSCGRAVPGLDVTLTNINNIPFSPGVATSDDGDVIYILPADPYDYKEAENMSRHICGAYNFVIGLGGIICSKEEALTKLIQGGISNQQRIGKTILQAKEEKRDVVEALKEEIDLRVLVEGEVLSNEQVTTKGHDIGLVTIKGDDGVTYYGDVKNETIVLRSDKEIIMTCPDLICCIEKDTYTPLTNAAIKKGMKVTYIGTPADDMWFAKAEGIEAWKPYFKDVGYDGEVVRY